MKPARYHPTARAELRAAVLHDEADRAGRGLDLEAAVRRVIGRLQLLPRSAPQWPRIEAGYEIRGAKVRRHPYLVVYAILPDHLVVLAVAHTAKQPGYWRARIE